MVAEWMTWDEMKPCVCSMHVELAVTCDDVSWRTGRGIPPRFAFWRASSKPQVYPRLQETEIPFLAGIAG
jgi:hypothetical protein